MMKVLIAMSGGVDSSVAAKLLCDEGYECIGCTMKLYDNCDAGLPRGRTCCSLDDVEDARSVAFSLGMRYYVFNFKDDFREKVIKKFASGYLRGQTPNPCIDCNRYMKFDKLFERAKLLGCDKIATGHYARIEFDGRKYQLKKALDKSKDQSYVLYMLTQEQLAHTLFPLGSLHKTDTRAIADTAGLSSAHKPDSQDICFVPDGDYTAFIERITKNKPRPGKFIHQNGQVLGTHQGLIHYTIGQRKGLGIAYEYPLYVIDKDIASNTVILGPNDALFQKALLAENCNLIAIDKLEAPLRVTAKTRYRQKDVPAVIEPLANGKIKVTFDEPQRAITPGQAVVFYDGDYVVGGGIIAAPLKE